MRIRVSNRPGDRWRALTGLAAVAWACVMSSATAQVSPEGVSAGIPYLSPMVPAVPYADAPPHVRPDAHLVPEPGYRPIMAMTELPGPSQNGDCICGHRSLIKKLFRNKCEVHPAAPPTFVPNPYEEQPLGTQMYDIMNTQVRNHDATRQVLNQYDFVDDSDRLNFAGRNKLMRIARGSQTNFAPIVVETTPRQPGLDLRRRERLTREIAAMGLPIPPDRVIIGQSYQQGLRGPDAMRLYQGTLAPLGQGGMGGGFGASAIGGMNNTGILPTMGSGSGGSGVSGTGGY